MLRSSFVGLLLTTFVISATSFAADPRTAFDDQLHHVIGKLNRQADVDVETPVLLSQLLQREYRTRPEEIRWAASHSVSWGEIVTLAYIQAATGRSFETMTNEGARQDFWSYVEKTEMTADKMTRNLESFLKLAEKERNTRIFERLRVSRRIQPMPDLGSGFGLFQEALDFRQIDAPRPTKVHTVVTVKAKGDQ